MSFEAVLILLMAVWYLMLLLVLTVDSLYRRWIRNRQVDRAKRIIAAIQRQVR